MKKALYRFTAIGLASLFLSACALFAPSVNPLVGTWATTIATPMGNMNADLEINEDMTGEMRSSELGSAPINNLETDGEDVSFSTTINAQGQMVTLDFTGTVEGDTLDGQFNTDFGALSVSGTRQ